MASGSLVDGSLRDQIYLLSRQPWQDRLLADLRVPLDPDALQAFANKAPDRWMQRLMMLAKLAGYSETTKVEISGLGGLVQELLGLSDAELFAKYGGIGAALPPAAAPPKALASGSTPGDFR